MVTGIAAITGDIGHITTVEAEDTITIETTFLRGLQGIAAGGITTGGIQAVITAEGTTDIHIGAGITGMEGMAVITEGVKVRWFQAFGCLRRLF